MGEREFQTSVTHCICAEERVRTRPNRRSSYRSSAEVRTSSGSIPFLPSTWPRPTPSSSPMFLQIPRRIKREPHLLCSFFIMSSTVTSARSDKQLLIRQAEQAVEIVLNSGETARYSFAKFDLHRVCNCPKRIPQLSCLVA